MKQHWISYFGSDGWEPSTVIDPYSSVWRDRPKHDNYWKAWAESLKIRHLDFYAGKEILMELTIEKWEEDNK